MLDPFNAGLPALPTVPRVLAALGADLGALRPAAEIAAALRTFTLPPLIDPDALAAIERSFAPLRQAVEAMRAPAALPSLV